MKIAVSVFVLLVVVCTATAYQCLPDTCKNMKCGPRVTESDCAQRNERYLEWGGYCGCCPKCIKTVREGDQCLHHIQGMLLDVECAPGLMCDVRSKKCIKQY